MKVFLLTILVSCSVYLSAQAQKTGVQPAGTAPAKLKTREDSVQYALGVYIGQWMMKTGIPSLTPGLFMSGLDDVLRNKPRQVKDSNALPMIYAYQQDMADDINKKMEAQLFTALKDKPNTGKLPNGVQYLVHKMGKGIKPGEMDSVIINFKGTLANGAIFEDTYARKVGIATTPGSVMTGLNEALQVMPEGSIWELYIPSTLAFGEKGNGTNIPPNSALIMLVELVMVKRVK